MELKDKKNLTERFLRLGMDSYSSMIAAECTQDEIDMLNDDKDFMSRVMWVQKKEVSNLLERLQSVMTINQGRGISTEIRWLLGKMDSSRFGEGLKLNGASDKKKFTITFETAGDTDDSNVEEFKPVGESDGGTEPDSPV